MTTAFLMEQLPPLSEFLTESVATVKQRETSALDELLHAHKNRCIIFGAGTLGRKAVALLREIGVEPLAVVDNNPARWGSEIDGIVVHSSAEAAVLYGPDPVYFVTIWNDFHWFRDTHARLNALGCVAVSSYAPIFWRFGKRFMDLLLLNEPAHLLYQHLDQIYAVEKLWADEESLNTYRANILWRALGDPSYLPFPAPVNTYFPADIFKLTANEAIVDCGAFDGDTIRMLLAQSGAQFKDLYAVEADTVSLAKMRAYLATLAPATARKVHILDCAVGAKRSTLQFVMTGALTSRSANSAEATDVACIPLDELFADSPVSLIKMDIEGAEYDALRGGRAIIQRDLPVLAICVYHTQSDIWRIPLLIRSMYPDYQFFLRSYDGDGFQTVLYAVPPHRQLSDAQRAAAPNPRKPFSL
jgi:FkbM family methyltransferase